MKKIELEKKRKKTVNSAKKTVNSAKKAGKPVKKAVTSAKTSKKISGYGEGKASTIISVEDVNKQVLKIAKNAPTMAQLEKLAGTDKPIVELSHLKAGYGKQEIVHDFNLSIASGQSLCIIGPNGAGKSTVLHSIFGFTNIFSGDISVRKKSDGNMHNITKQTPEQKLTSAGIAYIMQDNSVFPDMTVEENLWMGGYSLNNAEKTGEQVEKVFSKYERLAQRRNQPARVLSGGERRLLEISRALVTSPEVLLVDEPSIGLEPRYIDMVFEILADLQKNEKKTIIMVEQNAKKGLEFSDIGYVMVNGFVVIADAGDALLKNKAVGKLFLGG